MAKYIILNGKVNYIKCQSNIIYFFEAIIHKNRRYCNKQYRLFLFLPIVYFLNDV